ncbi:MAG: SLBB domain-containing protein, partial [Candidatus Latescibacteria bacterium]|nr:SLBB domain-containing protein [Candidatus Latescibacterota bacterium]
MITCFAHPGRYARIFYIVLIGVLTFDLVFYPIVANAQSRRRRDTRQTEEPPERRESTKPFSAPSLEETDTEAAQPVKVTSIGRAAFDAVIRSGRYIVGPGDIFTVIINIGEGIEIREIPVGASGSLLIPAVGSIQIAFLSLSEANRTIETAINKRFKQLDISVSLTQLRTFPISVTGEVRVPGAVGVNGVDQASQLIIKAGGLIDEASRKGSRRNIKILHVENGQMHDTGRRVDLMLWNLTGKEKYNPFILDGEQIIVPAKQDSISISGAVQRPGSYEFSPGDRVSDLITLANGLHTHSRPKLAKLLSNNENGEPVSINLDRALAKNDEADILLQAGDKLFVLGETKWVYVEGEVEFPGPFPLYQGFRLKDLLQRTKLKPDASIVQASLIRKVNYEQQVSTEDDPTLNRLLDIDREQRTDAEEALITLKTQQLSGRLPIDFAALMAGDEQGNILLRDGDVVRIPRSVPSVRVTGAVNAPANIPYDPTFKVSRYIDLAGGLNTRAKRTDIIIIEGNTGNAINATGDFKVRPGDAIVVPPRKIVPGQGYRIFRETLAMAGAIASLILTIQ